MDLTKYKDIFGKPKEGLHSYRIGNIAIVDVALTLIASYVINMYTQDSTLSIFIVLIIFSVLVHKIFGVETTLTKLF